MVGALVAIGFFALFFVLMSVRILLIKDGKFKGTCASQNPYLNKEGGTCGYCGKNVEAGENCGKEESPVSKVLSKFS